MKWILHDLVFGNDEQSNFVEALDELGHDYEIVRTYSDLPEGDIVRCSINMAKFWSPHKGIMCDFDAFKCTNYFPAFYEHLLSDNFVIQRYSEVVSNPDHFFNLWGNSDCIFIRPNGGDKVFDGQVVTKEELLTLKDQYCDDFGDPVVIVAEPRNIVEEYRVVVVGDKAVSGCRYKTKSISNLQLDVERIDPRHRVMDYVNKVLKEVDYRPGPAFIVDVAWSPLMGDRVVELNSFTCSGLYDADPKPIIENMSSLSL